MTPPGAVPLAVAASNERAVALYESLRFTILGTVPGGFRYPQEGPVGLYVMFRPVLRCRGTKSGTYLLRFRNR